MRIFGGEGFSVSGRGIVIVLSMVTLSITIVCLWLMRDGIREQYYLHCFVREDGDSKKRAASRLGEMRSLKAVQPLVRHSAMLLKSERTDEGAFFGGVALEIVKGSCVGSRALKDSLNDSEWTVRCVAARLIGELGAVDEETMGDLIGLLDDDSEMVRYNAVKVLAKVGSVGARACAELERLLIDEAEDVREAARQARRSIRCP